MKVDTVKHLSARLKVCDLGLKLSLWLITFATYRRNDLYRNSFSLSCTFKRREWPSHTYRESPDNSVASQQPGCYKRRRCSIRWVFRAHWKDRRQLLLFLVWCRTEGNFYISFVIHWLAKKKTDQILKQDHLIETKAISLFLSRCQFKFGGISKFEGEQSGQNALFPLHARQITNILVFRPISYVSFHCGALHVSAIPSIGWRKTRVLEVSCIWSIPQRSHRNGRVGEEVYLHKGTMKTTENSATPAL